jgi:hypothetical protein
MSYDYDDASQSGSTPADPVEDEEPEQKDPEQEHDDEESSPEKHHEEEEKKVSAGEGRRQELDRLQDGMIVFPDGFTTEDLVALLANIDVPSVFTPDAAEAYHQECVNVLKEEIVPDPEKPDEEDEDAVKLTEAFIAERLSDLQPVEGEHLAFAFTSFVVQEASICEISALANFQALLFIRLRTNLIYDATGLSDLPRLRELYLSENKLTSFSGISLPALEILDLSQNLLRAIGPLQLPKLRKLILSQNQIGFISPNTFTRLTSLVELNLNENKIKGFKPGTFAALEKLEIMKLDQNRLTRVDDTAFQGLTALKNLSISDGPLEAIDGLSILTALEALELKQTSLEALKNLTPLIDLKALKAVNFEGSPVDGVEAFKSDMILMLPWLEIIDEEPISFSDRQEAIALDEERKAEADRLRREAEQEASEKEAGGADEKEPETAEEEAKSEDATESSYATYGSDT